MVFNPNIPNPGDFVSVSQVSILNNFNNVNMQFERDHVSLIDGMESERGKHNKVSFSEQSGDPTVSGNNQSVYTKDNSGEPEVYSRLESNGTVYRWTKSAKIAPYFRLEAYVVFDGQGNILKNPNDEELSFNVSSISIPNPLVNGRNVRDDWIVNFTTNITTDKFFWIISAFGKNNEGIVFEQPIFGQTVPYMFGSYASAITTSMMRIMNKNSNGLSTASQLQIQTVCLQVYTLA